jgi:hypothetical protein
MTVLWSPAAGTDLICFLKAWLDFRMRRGVRLTQWVPRLSLVIFHRIHSAL